MTLRSLLQELARELDAESNAAHDLWTWLPSYRVCRYHHSEHVSDFRPPIADIMLEAADMLGDLTGNDAGAACVWNPDCPCGDDHE